MSLDLKISQLDENFAPALTDLVAVVVGANTRKVQLGNLGLETPLTPWTEEINADGNNLVNIGEFQFSIATQRMFSDAGGIILKVGSGDNIAFEVDFATITFNPAQADFGGTDINLANNSGMLQWGGLSNRRIVANTSIMQFSVPIGDWFQWTIDGVINVEMELRTTGIDLDTPNATLGKTINLQNEGGITWAGSVNRSIFNDLTGTIFDVPTGDDYFWKKNGATVMALLPNTDTPSLDLSFGTQLSPMRINFENGGGIQWEGTNDRSITNSTGGTQFRIEEGDQFTWHIEPNGMQEARLNVTTFSIDNKYMEMKSIAEPGNTGAVTTGRIFMDSGNSNHLSIKRDTTVFDLEATIGQTPWTSHIDADGFDLKDLNNIEFRPTGSSSPGSIANIHKTSIGLKLNAPLNQRILLLVNGFLEYDFSASQADFKSNNIINLGTLNTHTIPGGTGTFALLSDITGQTPWLADIDAADFSLNNLDILNFNNVTGTPTITAAEIFQNPSTGMTLNVPNGDSVDFMVNGVLQYSFDALICDFNDNNLDMGQGRINFRNATQNIDGVNNLDMDFRVPTSGQYNFQINSLTEFTFHSTGLLMKGNPIIDAEYLESGTANPATSGFIRMANNLDSIRFRNAANNGDLSIRVASNDRFNFGGAAFESITGISSTGTVAGGGFINMTNAQSIEWRNGAASADLVLDIAGDRLRYESVNLVGISTTDTLTNKTMGDTLNLGGFNLDNIQNLIHDLSTSGLDIDFAEDELQEISIAADTVFTGTGYAIGKAKTLKIVTDATLRTLTFPAGWVFVGAKPADQAASKTGILTLQSFTAAEAGVVAAYAVEA